MQEDQNQIVDQPLPTPPSDESNKQLALVVSALAIIAIVVAAAFFFFYRKSSVSNQNPNTQAKSVPTETTKESASNVSSTGNTNQQLDKDMGTVDKDFANFDTDSKSVDQSLNDQATNLQ